MTLNTFYYVTAVRVSNKQEKDERFSCQLDYSNYNRVCNTLVGHVQVSLPQPFLPMVGFDSWALSLNNTIILFVPFTPLPNSPPLNTITGLTFATNPSLADPWTIRIDEKQSNFVVTSATPITSTSLFAASISHDYPTSYIFIMNVQFMNADLVGASRCPLVVAHIRFSASNDVVVRTGGRWTNGDDFVMDNDLAEHPLIPPTPADDAALYDVSHELFMGSIAPLTGSPDGKLAMTMKPYGTGGGSTNQGTEFKFEVVYGCAESNPHLTTDKAVQKNFDQFAAGFGSMASVQTLFPTAGPSTTTDKTGSPTPDNRPSIADGVESVSGATIPLSSFTIVAIGLFVTTMVFVAV